MIPVKNVVPLPKGHGPQAENHCPMGSPHLYQCPSGHTQVCGHTLPGLLKCAVVRWNYMHVPECMAFSHSSAHRFFCFLRPPHTHPQHTGGVPGSATQATVSGKSTIRTLVHSFPLISPFLLLALPPQNLYIIIHTVCNKMENPDAMFTMIHKNSWLLCTLGLTLLLSPCTYKTNIQMTVKYRI